MMALVGLLLGAGCMAMTVMFVVDQIVQDREVKARWKREDDARRAYWSRYFREDDTP